MRCRSLLYADNDSAARQPVLSARAVTDVISQLEALLNKLEQVVANVLKDIDNKKRVKQFNNQSAN